MFENYDFKSGTGLLYFHILCLEIPKSLLKEKDIELNKYNCEYGEQLFHQFKVSVTHSNHEKKNELKSLIFSYHWKKCYNFVFVKKQVSQQKKDFFKLFHSKYKKLLDKNSYIKKIYVPDCFLNYLDANTFNERDGVLYINKETFEKLVESKRKEYNLNKTN